MKTTRRSYRQLVLSLFTVSLVLTSLAGESMPSLLTTKSEHVDKSYPTWVSASAASRADGSLESGLFHPGLWERLQKLLNVPPDPVKGCVPISEVLEAWVAPPDMSSLEAAFRSSELVLRGRVVDREFGFDRGTPGQLFRVDRIEDFKGKNVLNVYYFFVPVGHFKAGKTEICKTDYRFPNIPAVEDEVVLLIPGVTDGDPFLDLTFESGLLVLRGEAALLPGLPGEKRTSTKSILLSELSRLAAEAKQ